jgi:hypothetical protein
MKQSPIKKSIFFNSAIIIGLALIMILIGYFAFNGSTIYTEEIVPLNMNLTEIVHLEAHLDSFNNPRAFTEFGLPENVAEMGFGSFVHPEDINRFVSSVENAVANRTDWDFEDRLVAPTWYSDGSEESHPRYLSVMK